MANRTAYYWDPAFLGHDTGQLECAGRAERLRPERLASRVPGLDARAVRAHGAEEWILRVHAAEHVERVRAHCGRGWGILDHPDTLAGPGSFETALAAVDAALTAADAVVAGEAANAFCAVRPPGHHALPNWSMGFCLFSTAAVLVRYLQRRHGLGRIAIVDWDVHHGNGTQHIFWTDPDVLYVSLHQHPFYPGSGLASERGEGAGEGTTLNIPLPAGTPEEAYLARFEAEALSAVRAHRPEAVVVSAGFDAHRDDLLGGLRLGAEGFGRLTASLAEAAAEACGGRIVSLLEGGYHLEALERSAAAHLLALMGGAFRAPAES